MRPFLMEKGAIMNILTFDKTAIINYDYVADIHIKDRDTSGFYMITADHAGDTLVRGGAKAMAFYKNLECCKYALEMLFAAMRNGEATFEFPSESDIAERMRSAKQARIHVKTKGNLHGGS